MGGKQLAGVLEIIHPPQDHGYGFVTYFASASLAKLQSASFTATMISGSGSAASGQGAARLRHRHLRHPLPPRGIRPLPALRPFDARTGARDHRRQRRAPPHPLPPRAVALDGGDAQALLKDGDIPAACKAFADSLRLEEAVGTMLNLADCR